MRRGKERKLMIQRETARDADRERVRETDKESERQTERKRDKKIKIKKVDLGTTEAKN